MTLRASIARRKKTRSVSAIKPELLRLLDALPRTKQAQLLGFARLLHQQTAPVHPGPTPVAPQIELRTVPATTMLGLTDLVALGGDAVADTEALYDGDNNGLR